MFLWDKSISQINVPASKVVHLFRSMREVQLALPGVAAQEASAFLCQYLAEDGVATVAVFHLHKNKLLAFYRSDPHIVPAQKTDSMLDQGLNFVESMGFLMTDQDIHLLDENDQEMLWASLPLKSGLPDEAADAQVPVPQETTPGQVQAKVAETVVAAVMHEQQPIPTIKGSPGNVKPEVRSPGSGQAVLQSAPQAEVSVDNVDDLLAAVEAMRAKRPGLRARKQPPTAEEMERRRMQLRETVGRILASL
jgi:hypothetical protein